jgi:hypothetical protein
MVQQDLRGLARSRIGAGQLPPCVEVILLGSTGSGIPCALCDAPIAIHEVEYEVQVASRRGSSWRFHIRCHAVWRDVCDELWPPEPSPQGQTA